MKTRYGRLSRLIGILATALVIAAPLATKAAAPSSDSNKLDKRLTVIAAAAIEQRTESLMASALTRELSQQNSPFDVRWNAAGQVQVYLHFDKYGNPPSDAELATLGATDVVVSPELGVVQA
ncbi:MAG: hypothetical protein ACRESO_08870, partial [Gammaproteobacteria bacterium]